MDTNKFSNLFSHLKDKYGGGSVTLLRNREFIVKKMADYRNHRMFTLRCIKTGITPVNCRLKNSLNSYQSCHVIHRAGKTTVM